ncbi:MAG: GvpL/GvpF family gas vesicle protein [Gemmatimonadetes bacterium]|nr:GvpL/GvpF family gas vesicle protein [Gemmatimonadota bacterium]
MERAQEPRVQPDAGAGAGRAGAAGRARGLRLFGVLRRRPLLPGSPGDAAALVQIAHRDITALLRPEPFVLPAVTGDAVAEHHRIVERAMRRSAILPAPFGVVFRDAATVAAFLAAEYLRLDEGLDYVEGHWELRLDLRFRHSTEARGAGGAPSVDLGVFADNVYVELGYAARAAVRFEAGPDTILSAAFLVERRRWREFLEHVHHLEGECPEVVAGTSGPWPPYDFVRMTPRAAGE